MIDPGRLREFEAGGIRDVGDTVSKLPPHWPSAGQEFSLIRSHMAHHSGMSLLALDQALLGQPMHGRFLSDPRIRASLLLLQERIPLAEVRTRLDMTRVDLTPARAGSLDDRSDCSTADSPVRVHLLSNGRYHVMIRRRGGPAMAGPGLTRWRKRHRAIGNSYVRDWILEFWSATVTDRLRVSRPNSRKGRQFRATRRHSIICGWRCPRTTSSCGAGLLNLSIGSVISRSSYAEVALLNG
jgi:hypothetical protein